MSTGYNWIDTLVHFASISGILAGFSVTFIALILGGQVADVDICTTGITFGQISVLLFGISTGLFICSSQRFIHAQEFNLWDLPSEYVRFLKEKLKEQEKEWDSYLLESDAKCRRYEKEGRITYNLAIVVMLGGLFLAIAPYNVVIALFVTGLGYLLEMYQYLK